MKKGQESKVNELRLREEKVASPKGKNVKNR